MKYYTMAPPSSLAAYVRFFWVLEGNEPYCHRSMADGCAEMVFHYKGLFNEVTSPSRVERSFASGLHGPSKNFRRFSIHEIFGIFGMYLYPFAIPQLFSIPASELSDQSPDLSTLLGKEGGELEEKIMIANTNSQRVAILTSFLEKKLAAGNNGNLALNAAISDIIHSGGSVSVKELANRSFLSIRQFERKFITSSGFAPKLYSRIIRFQHAIQQYGNAQKSLTDIAYECGYYDQSHFIHDFKQFSGYHPKQYFSGNAEAVLWKDSSN